MRLFPPRNLSASVFISLLVTPGAGTLASRHLWPPMHTPPSRAAFPLEPGPGQGTGTARSGAPSRAWRQHLAVVGLCRKLGVGVEMLLESRLFSG